LNYLACISTILKEAAKIISKHKIDYVYSYMPGTGSSIPAMKICSKYDIPFVLDLADMYSMIRPKMVIEKSFRNADKILVITNYLKNDLLKKGITSDKIQIIPNGVDLELFNSDVISLEEIKNIRQTFQSQKIVIFSGSLQDLNIIIESALHVIEKIPDVKFVIIGDHRDPNRSKSFWENKTRERKLHEHFVFLGRLPRKEIPRYILSADVCIDSFPNEPYYAAAHPIKLLEYGACGKPVVATNVEETKNLITHGRYGFLSDPSNPKEYAKYVIQLLTNQDLANKMGQEFSEYIKNNFSWDKISEKVEEILT
jgi:glycosyltransferase involved in cell wall biosynthesis